MLRQDAGCADVPGKTPVRTGEPCGWSTSDPDAHRTPDGGQGPGSAQCPNSCTVKAFPAGSCECPHQGCSLGEPWASQQEAASMPLLLGGEEEPQRRAPSQQPEQGRASRGAGACGGLPRRLVSLEVCCRVPLSPVRSSISFPQHSILSTAALVFSSTKCSSCQWWGQALCWPGWRTQGLS